MNLLFVCRGNAARSQMAEAYYNAHVQHGAATSAGTRVSLDKPVPEDVLIALTEAGIDASNAYRKSVTKTMADEADRIILITNENVPDYLQHNPKVIKWYVPDPRGKGLEAQRATLRIIQQKVNALGDDGSHKN